MPLTGNQQLSLYVTVAVKRSCRTAAALPVDDNDWRCKDLKELKATYRKIMHKLFVYLFLT